MGAHFLQAYGKRFNFASAAGIVIETHKHKCDFNNLVEKREAANTTASPILPEISDPAQNPNRTMRLPQRRPGESIFSFTSQALAAFKGSVVTAE